MKLCPLLNKQCIEQECIAYTKTSAHVGQIGDREATIGRNQIVCAAMNIVIGTVS